MLIDEEKLDYDVEKLQKEVGKELRKLRLKRGHDNSDNFAYDHDLPRMQYWRMEAGKANFTIKSLLGILQIHGVSFEKFMRKIKID